MSRLSSDGHLEMISDHKVPRHLFTITCKEWIENGRVTVSKAVEKYNQSGEKSDRARQLQGRAGGWTGLQTRVRGIGRS